MKPIPRAILAVTLLTPFPTLHAQSSPCSCDELNNIQNRLANVENVIRAYTDAFRGTPEGDEWTYSKWVAMRDKIDQQTAKLPSPYPHSYKGIAEAHTDFFCNITLPKDVSLCILESLRLHEEVHQNACRHPVHGEPGLLEDWQNLQTMREALFEEIQGYNTERRFLQEQKHKLECSCPYYAIHFNYLGFVDIQRVPVAARQATATPVPVEIPLTLKDDGTCSGEATAILQGDGTLRAPSAQCVSTDQGVVRLRASGMIAGPDNSPQMHLEASSDAPPEHSTALNCVTNIGPYRRFSQTGNLPYPSTFRLSSASNDPLNCWSSGGQI